MVSMTFLSCPPLQCFEMHSYVYTNIKYRSSQTRIINFLYRVFVSHIRKCCILNIEYISFILAVTSTCLYLHLHMCIFTQF